MHAPRSGLALTRPSTLRRSNDPSQAPPLRVKSPPRVATRATSSPRPRPRATSRSRATSSPRTTSAPDPAARASLPRPVVGDLPTESWHERESVPALFLIFGPRTRGPSVSSPGPPADVPRGTLTSEQPLVTLLGQLLQQVAQVPHTILEPR